MSNISYEPMDILKALCGASERLGVDKDTGRLIIGVKEGHFFTPMIDP